MAPPAAPTHAIKTASPPPTPGPADHEPSATATDGGTRTWARNFTVPGLPDTPAQGRVGLCLSGGGIRSATFALGATQVLTEEGVLDEVEYIAAVSGGGYHAGSHQMLRARGRDHGHPVRLADAFAAGSPEEDHRRRHGKYIANSGGAWFRAVAVVARNLAFSLAILYSGLLVAARLLGWGYAQLQPWSTPLFELSPERCCPEASCADPCAAGFEPATCPPPDVAFPCAWSMPPFGRGTLLAIAVPAVIAAGLWVWSGVGSSPKTTDARARTAPTQRRYRWESWAVGAAAITGVTALLLLAGPLTVRAVQWLATTPLDPTEGPGAAATGGLGALAITIWNMVARSRATDAQATRPTSRPRRVLERAGFATRALLSFAVVGGLVLAALLVLGFELERAVDAYFDRPPQALLVDLWVLLPVLGLALVGIFLDQTRMSLHPFYKRRLATAFSVERTADGGAQELDFAYPTLLSEVASPTSQDGRGPGSRPRLLLCAAAHTSDADLAPPGRRVTPIVFSDEWVGGPQLGYFVTSDLERAVQGRAYEGDVTTLAAMALSGAAFASAMGRLSGPFNILLAITNSRLGAWLPNPRYHARLRSADDGETAMLAHGRQPLPRVRRLSYWLREIVGSYPADDRFIYISDGGHYENLGLVELLRRGCDPIYCIDASGDVGAQGLAAAATVAYEELGVRIEIDGSPLVPRQDGEERVDGSQLLPRLEHRLARQAVVRGEILYPETGPAPNRIGRLYVGKAVLTGEVPFPILAHALSAERFPSDTTADQWFDSAQFEAYRALGRWVASQLARA